MTDAYELFFIFHSIVAFLIHAIMGLSRRQVPSKVRLSSSNMKGTYLPSRYQKPGLRAKKSFQPESPYWVVLLCGREFSPPLPLVEQAKKAASIGGRQVGSGRRQPGVWGL